MGTGVFGELGTLGLRRGLGRSERERGSWLCLWVWGARYSRPAARLGAIGARERERERESQKQYGNRCLGKAIIQAYAKTIMGTGVWEEANVRNMPRTVWEHMFGEKIM
jgi:hypothetical protein